MVNFGQQAAEIVSLVWGTPAYFNRFRVLAALLHGTLVGGRQTNFAALNRGRHLYSAGRLSRWSLAHISSYFNYGRTMEWDRPLYFALRFLSFFFLLLLFFLA